MWMRVNPSMLALARAIKAHGAKIAILSNMPTDLLGHIRAGFDWLDDFDVQIWSCEHGCIKPHAKIYELCLAALGCEPVRTVFFDDRPVNVESAQQLGMEAHVFTSPEQAWAVVRAGIPLEAREAATPDP